MATVSCLLILIKKASTAAYSSPGSQLRKALDLPIVGELPYRLNVSRFVVTKMAREHFYSEPNRLSGDRLAAKLAVTRTPAARHGSVRFVSGYLDWIGSRAEFLDLVRKADKPTVLIYGNETPPRSRAEMEALGDRPNVRVERSPNGKLSIHEEFPDSVAPAIKSFLQR